MKRIKTLKVIVSAVTGAIFLLSTHYVLATDLFINEVLPNPEGTDQDNEWVELYNASDTEIDVNGYKLKDKAGNQLIIDSSRVNDSTIVDASNWLVIYRNGHSSFSLNNSGDEIINLFDTISSDPVNIFSYSGSEENKSWGRLSDGEEISVEILSITPGSANQPQPSPTPSPTPSPSPSPSPDPSPTPSPKPISSPSPSPSPDSEPIGISTTGIIPEGGETTESGLMLLSTKSGEVKGASEASKAAKNKKPIIIAVVLIILGLGLVIGTGVVFYQEQKYNEKDEKY